MLFGSDGGPARTIASPPNTFGQTIKFSADGRFVALQVRGDPVLHVVQLDEAKSLREIPNPRGGFAVGDAIVTVTPTSSTEAAVRAWPFMGGPPALVGRIAIPKSFIDSHLTYGREDMREVALEPDSIMPDGSIIYAEGGSVYLQGVGGVRPELLWNVGEPVVRANAFEEGATIGVQTRNGIAVRFGDGTMRSLTSSRIRVDSIAGPYDLRGTRAAFTVRAAGGPSTAGLWDLATPSGNVTLLGGGEARDFAFDSEGRWLAASMLGGAGPIQLFSLDQPAPRIIAHTVGASAANSLMFAGDARSIISCGLTGGFHRWRLAFPDQPTIEVPFGQCVTAAVAPDGRYAVAGFSDLFLISLLDGTVRKLIDAEGVTLAGTAFDPAGEIVAASFFRTSDPRKPVIRIVNVRTGRVDDLMIEGGAAGDIPAKGMAFGADGTLYTGGEGGIRRCSVAEKTCVTWRAARVAQVALSGNRRFLLAAMYKEGQAISASEGELLLIDLQTGTERVIPGFGADMTHIAINHSGTTIAARGRAPTLTIAATTGDPPHVIPGAGSSMVGAPSGLAISPDDKWLLMNQGPEIRLYPMPDLSQPPLHTLPYEQLMSRLDAMTNVRAVHDPGSATGYKLEAGPFPGWRHVPRWQ
jgi:hypothetical protein